MKASVIVGLGFGDEGKGLTTDYLCQNAEKPIVIRFNGGQQAGHTVVTQNGLIHTFSNFGSGTYRHVPTYWSAYCTFFPEGTISELKELNVKPKLLIDLDCTVTTHYDILYNRALEVSMSNSQRGSCGLGYGATVTRSKLPHLCLKVSDLLYKNVYLSKLRAIRSYYREKINTETPFNFDSFKHNSQDEQFSNYIDQLHNLICDGCIQLVSVTDVLSSSSGYQTFIFEGAQGVMLDQNFGFFPYITKSNTTSQNAVALIKKNLPAETEVDIIYVTRCYHTRHGAGPLAPSNHEPILKPSHEANVYNEFQRNFRTSYLNINMLNYALKCDSVFSEQYNKRLIITCIDQLMDDSLQCCRDGQVFSVKYFILPELLNCKFSTYNFSFSNCSSDLK